MSETEPEHWGHPGWPAPRRPVTERSPERRKPVRDALSALAAIRDLALAPDAADRSDPALVARVRELLDRELLDRESPDGGWADEDDGR